MIDGLEGRAAATVSLARWFRFDHLPAGFPRDVSQMFAEFAASLLEVLPDGQQLTDGLRKLLEAKDCATRAAVAASRGESS